MAIINGRNVESFLAITLLFSALLISSTLIPSPGFADRIVAIRQGTTLDIGCDLSSNDDFITTTKVFNHDKPSKITFNCERPGGDVNLKKYESIALRCLYDNPLTVPKHVKMKAGEIFYVLCNAKDNSERVVQAR
jgi:hypothetical protein